MTAIDISSFAGLTAMVLLTINILLGLVLSARYNTVRQWPHRRLPIFDIHNWTAYVAFGLILFHPIVLLFSSTAGFVPLDIVWPVHSPKQTLYNCFGGVAFYSVIFVVITSYFRSKFGSRLWKKLHFVSYPAAFFVFLHGTLIDPNLKGLSPDYLDGEKVLVESCALLIVVATVWRVRYRPKKRNLVASIKKVDYEAV
jgi:sulfoxide reductase heme-binding subunit YedZ